MFGNLEFSNAFQTGMPGSICPKTRAFLISNPLTPTSAEVIPPFATTKAGFIFKFLTKWYTPSEIFTLLLKAVSGLSQSKDISTLSVYITTFFPCLINSSSIFTKRSTSNSKASSLFKISEHLNSSASTLF